MRNLLCSLINDKLLLFPSRVLTRSGSADPELTVSACVIVTLGTPTRTPSIGEGIKTTSLVVLYALRL